MTINYISTDKPQSHYNIGIDIKRKTDREIDSQWNKNIEAYLISFIEISKRCNNDIMV